MPPDADRRGDARPAGAARQARLPPGRRRPRVRRQPALPAAARSRRSRRISSATRSSCRGLVELIVEKYDGSLKAEHGTGRNMAPYVEREWGAAAVDYMWRIKSLADPDGVLAPDVLLSRDAGVHLRALKTTPAIEDGGDANRCIECGFCEPVCPSRDLTTTPRQRIVLRREMARQPDGSAVTEALVREYEYDGDRDVRGRRLVPARLSREHRHRQADQGAAHRVAHAARRRSSGASLPSATRWPSARRGPGCARAGSRRAWSATAASSASRARCGCRTGSRRRRGRRRRRCRRRAARAPRPSICPRASTASSASRGTRRTRRCRCPRRWSPCRREPGSRCGFPPTSPARAARRRGARRATPTAAR